MLIKEQQQITLLKACRIAGGQKQLAQQINVSASRLNKWITRRTMSERKIIPHVYALAIEKVTQGKITCRELIPKKTKIEKLKEKNVPTKKRE